MSNFNNKYGVSNECPAIMSDGRGVKTNYQNNHNINADLKKQVNATTSYDFRLNLQKQGQKLLDGPTVQNILEFSCGTVPHGNVTLNPNIKLDNGPNSSFLDAFRPLTQ